MKKFLLLFCFSFFTFHSSFSQGVWTWMGGAQGSGSPGTFGTQGVPSVNNLPPSLIEAFSWTDLQGNFWLFGGSTINSSYGDLWKFNPISLEWTWVNGNGAPNGTPAVYGTKGIASPKNSPGCRGNTNCNWTDKNGDLWLYGGSNTANMYPNDLWKYNIASNEWTWVSGDTVSSIPFYGTIGVPSTVNNPGSRWSVGAHLVDSSGNFWFYGGRGSGPGGDYSDMWMYNPATNMWAWEAGLQGLGAQPVYGSKGIFSATNTPGGREASNAMVENTGSFLLFGGIRENNGLTYADLWEYNPTLNEWAWINGTQQTDAAGVEGNPCQSDSTFYPDARSYTAGTWKDCIGNIWLYGGLPGYPNVLSDVWVYFTGTNKWARISASSFENTSPVFGSLGVPAPSNNAGSREASCYWQDKRGNFWVFGGFNNNNIVGDLWRFQPDYACINSNCGCAASTGMVTASRDSICYGTGVTSTLSISGNTGGIQWQSSTDSINFTRLSGDTLSTYTTPPTLSQTTYYCTITRDSCSSTSNIVAVHVVPAPSTNFTYTINGNQVSFQPDSVTGNVVTYEWNFGDGKMSNDLNPTHTFDTLKTYYVCLTVYNRSNCSFTNCEYVNILSTGVKNISSEQNSLLLYPNPANNQLTIEVLNGEAPKQISITNDLGRTLIQLSTYKTKTEIDIHALAAGIYFVKTQLSDGSVEVNKLVKE